MTPFILERAAYVTGRSIEEITGPSRIPALCLIRYAIMDIMREQGLSLPRIGRRLKRDHTTVLYGLRRAAELSGSKKFIEIRSAIA